MPKPRTRMEWRSRRTLLRTILGLGVVVAQAAFAQEAPPPSFPELWAALQNDAATTAPVAPKPDFSTDIEARKSYAIPAFEIIGFDVLLNLANRNFIGEPYHS